MPLATTASKGAELELIANAQVHVLACKDRRPDLLVQALETGREIHGVAERRVIHALGRSDIADDGLTDMNAEPRDERLQAVGLELDVEPLAGGLGRKRRPAGARDMVRLRIGARSRTP